MTDENHKVQGAYIVIIKTKEAFDRANEKLAPNFQIYDYPRCCEHIQIPRRYVALFVHCSMQEGVFQVYSEEFRLSEFSAEYTTLSLEEFLKLDLELECTIARLME